MPEPIKIRRALISVYDKTGIVDFARAVHEEFGIEIISTGGTAKTLTEAGIPVTLVEDITGFPELLGGRVKTLHPKIFAAILADRDNPEHMRQLKEQGIEPIDMVVVNLYPFEKTVADPNCKFEDALEMIDIGGVCLLRAAAKNQRHVLVVSEADEVFYEKMLAYIRDWDRSVPGDDLHRRTAWGAFWQVARYNAAIATWLSKDVAEYPAELRALHMRNWGELHYGENPHQQAELLELQGVPCSADLVYADALWESEREMSFNNYADANAALELCAELTQALAYEEPRASARADSRSALVSPLSMVFNEPDGNSPTWLLTWTTYGSWLPGDERGFVGRVPAESGKHVVHNLPGTSYDADRQELEDAARERMQGRPVKLDQQTADTALAACVEAARAHDISLLALSIMPDRVHLLCQGEQDGAKLMQLFKGISARRLSQAHALTDAPRWWTKSGSRRYIPKGADLQPAVRYVCDQHDALCVCSFETLSGSHARCVRSAARAEARGSPLAPAGCACCFIKHTNACGVGIADDPIEAYRRAYLGDPKAAMGGILALNFNVDAAFAEPVMDSLQRWGKEAGAGAFFVEVWLAPSFDEAAVKLIRTKKKWGERVRLLDVGNMTTPPDPNELEFKSIAGGMLAQTRDSVGLNEDQWKVVTERQATDQEMANLRLAWLIAKHTKSNAVSICKDGMLIGNGAGQMSRVMSCRIATWLAKDSRHEEKLHGAAAASDGFFPFRDGLDLLVDAGITAIIQPGGSKRDQKVIDACNERGVAMIFTGTRHFKH